jgi:hypothetical protein
MTTIPNELIININTNIYGFKNIKYFPSMTIKNFNNNFSNDNTTVLFNPLIKLNKSTVDKIPEDKRKKAFFNKQLFNLLINFSNNEIYTDLFQATQKGNIDNNINITLSSLFTNNSVINIGRNSYIITNFQWKSGTWKINTKNNSSYGLKQLKQLPSTVIYGQNYTILNKDNTVNINSSQNQQEQERSTKLFQKVVEPNELILSKTTNNFQKLFLNNNFFYLINNLYKASDVNFKKIIQQNLNQTIRNTNNLINSSLKLNYSSFKESIYGIKIITNSGGGDCFFIAVSDAINYYNYYNQTERIISKIYGIGTNLFTQKYLRTLVLEFIQTWSELDDQLENVAPINVDNLNDIFSQSLNEIILNQQNINNNISISSEKYVDLAKQIYKSNENFLVENVDGVPLNIYDYKKPFKIIKKSNLENYILSNNYWANYVAIFALSSKLKLNIIPISTKENSLNIPFANFNIEFNNWNKYLFLYYNNSHFELITFDYKTSVLENNNFTSEKYTLSKKVIFNNTTLIKDLPPINILLIIFGAYYTNIKDLSDKNLFTFQQNIMVQIENTIDKLRVLNFQEFKQLFYPTFKYFFPTSNLKLQIDKNVEREPSSSQLAYFITIDLELYPVKIVQGKKISSEEINNFKCSQKWNSVRKAYSEFIGKPYVIQKYHQNQAISRPQLRQNNRPYNRQNYTQNNRPYYRQNYTQNNRPYYRQKYAEKYKI